MSKFIHLIIVLLLGGSMYAQQIRKSSLSTAGGSASTAHAHMVFAVGELAVREQSTSTAHLSEGFVGPDIAAIMGIESYARLEGVSCYPNPVSDYAHLSFSRSGNFDIVMHDMHGRLVWQGEATGEKADISVGNLQPGVYFLTVIDRESQAYVTFKLQKK